MTWTPGIAWAVLDRANSFCAAEWERGKEKFLGFQKWVAKYGKPGQTEMTLKPRSFSPVEMLSKFVSGRLVFWAVNSNARTGEKAKKILKSQIPNLKFPNFFGLVLGCIEAKICK